MLGWFGFMHLCNGQRYNSMNEYATMINLKINGQVDTDLILDWQGFGRFCLKDRLGVEYVNCSSVCV